MCEAGKRGPSRSPGRLDLNDLLELFDVNVIDRGTDKTIITATTVARTNLNHFAILTPIRVISCLRI
jgi:hypothetical protein